jgi:hypothetical protein
MLAAEAPLPESHPQPPRPGGSFSPGTANRLERADFSREARLLDASIAGVVLSFNPRDDEMRQKADRSWKTIRTLLADHLFTREDAVPPWSGDESMGSPTARDLFKKRYAEVRSLARTVSSVSFEHGSDADISRAGRALCRLAVKLDDLMGGTPASAGAQGSSVRVLIGTGSRAVRLSDSEWLETFSERFGR